MSIDQISTSILTRAIQEHTPALLACRENRTHNTSHHMVVIVKRGKVIASAQNRVGNRSKGSGYSDYTIHAERAVVKKLGDISQQRRRFVCGVFLRLMLCLLRLVMSAVSFSRNAWTSMVSAQFSIRIQSFLFDYAP